ncbi:unnamed protein product [Linum trigynum]|uniref:Uncharacterized protein n=1 Tax=Linum trigynum TaxID=586398 RepID=A0AAV2GB66_9ROSI
MEDENAGELVTALEMELELDPHLLNLEMELHFPGMEMEKYSSSMLCFSLFSPRDFLRRNGSSCWRNVGVLE